MGGLGNIFGAMPDHHATPARLPIVNDTIAMATILTDAFRGAAGYLYAYA